MPASTNVRFLPSPLSPTRSSWTSQVHTVLPDQAGHHRYIRSYQIKLDITGTYSPTRSSQTSQVHTVLPDQAGHHRYIQSYQTKLDIIGTYSPTRSSWTSQVHTVLPDQAGHHRYIQSYHIKLDIIGTYSPTRSSQTSQVHTVLPDQARHHRYIQSCFIYPVREAANKVNFFKATPLRGGGETLKKNLMICLMNKYKDWLGRMGGGGAGLNSVTLLLL